AQPVPDILHPCFPHTRPPLRPHVSIGDRAASPPHSVHVPEQAHRLPRPLVRRPPLLHHPPTPQLDVGPDLPVHVVPHAGAEDSTPNLRAARFEAHARAPPSTRAIAST